MKWSPVNAAVFAAGMMTGTISTYTISVDIGDINFVVVLTLGGSVGLLTIVVLILSKNKDPGTRASRIYTQLSCDHLTQYTGWQVKLLAITLFQHATF